MYLHNTTYNNVTNLRFIPTSYHITPSTKIATEESWQVKKQDYTWSVKSGRRQVYWRAQRHRRRWPQLRRWDRRFRVPWGRRLRGWREWNRRWWRKHRNWPWMREILTVLESSEDEPSEFGLTVTVFVSLRYISLRTLNNGRRNPKPKPHSSTTTISNSLFRTLKFGPMSPSIQWVLCKQAFNLAFPLALQI